MRMTHLDDIISGSTDESTSTSNLLRKVLIVGHRLKADQIIGWAKQELGGYSSDAELPSYRRGLVAPVIGQWDGPFGHSVFHSIDTMGIPEDLREPLFTVDLRQSVAELEAWVRCGEPKMQHWSSQAIFLYRKLAEDGEVPQIENRMLNNVYKEISMDTVRGAIDSIRTKTLELALDLQNVNPDAGESTAAASTVENDKGIANVVNHFEFTVFGDGANVSYGDNAIQTTAVSHGDTEGFIQAIRALGIGGQALEKMKEAAEAPDSERPSRIKQVLERIKYGVISIGTTVATKAITSQVEQLAQQFLGN